MSLFVPLSIDVKSWPFMPNSYLNFETVCPSPPPKKKSLKNRNIHRGKYIHDSVKEERVAPQVARNVFSTPIKMYTNSCSVGNSSLYCINIAVYLHIFFSVGVLLYCINIFGAFAFSCWVCLGLHVQVAIWGAVVHPQFGNVVCV